MMFWPAASNRRDNLMRVHFEAIDKEAALGPAAGTQVNDTITIALENRAVAKVNTFKSRVVALDADRAALDQKKLRLDLGMALG
jgi:hypothetical protein